MTQSTFQIPTAARGAVRAFVKALAGFDAFAASIGVPSREVKNADLLIFAEREGKLDDVRAIIAKATNAEIEASMPAIAEEYDAMQKAVAEACAENDAAFGTYKMEDVLSNVEDFLSPLVRKELEKVLQPILEKANRGPIVKEVEKIVTVEAAPIAPAGKAPYPVKTGKSVEFAKLFGVRTTQAWGKQPISLWNSHGYSPAIDPYFVVDGQVMAVIATAAEHGTNVWMVGPSGSGKTTTPKQFAAYTGRPFTSIGFSRQTEVADLTGSTGIRDGNTEWDDGALISAMKTPGMVILFDEPTFAPAGVMAIIQATTDDHRSYTVHATGEVVKCAPGVVFIIADNTNGAGDETGQYAGTNQANTALVNRFKRMVRVDYMSKAQETAALVNHTNIPWAAAEHVADFMHRARKLPEMEGVALSLRQMVGFVDMVKDGFSAKFSFECAVLTRLPGTERAAIETMATLQWSEAFEQLLSGSTAAPEVVNAPADTEASHAFDDEVSATFVR